MRKRTQSLISFTILAVMSIVAWQVHRVPSYDSVKNAFKTSDRAILDRNGLLLDEIHPAKTAHRLKWITYDEAPYALIDALNSVDVAAQVANLLNSSQLFLRITWTREQLAETYLNLSLYRGELQGLQAASFGIFDKPPRDLTRVESALILALIGVEAVDSEPAKSKACAFLADLGDRESCGLLPEAHLAALEKGYRINPFVSLAPKLKGKFADAKSPIVRSSLDRQIQWAALHALQTRKVEKGAVVVLENSTGNVLAYVDSSKDEAHDVGGMLKPLLFAQALEERVVTAATLVEQSTIFVGRKSRPRPSDMVTVRTALASNLNIPALKILELLGSENFAKTLKRMELTASSETDGPSLAVGNVSVSLLNLTNAYRTLKNGGVWSPVRFSPNQLSERAAEKIVGPGSVFIVTDILRDKNGFVQFTDTDGSKPDHWTVGIANAFTVGVWAENSDETIAIYRDLLAALPAIENAPGLEPSEDLKRVSGEWFLKGTEPKVDGTSTSRISFPQNHSMIVLEEEKLRHDEPLLIQVALPQPNQNLYLNGQRLGRAKSYLPWAPYAGKFTLELRDSGGQVLDRVRFEVRGRSFARVALRKHLG